MRPQRGAVGWRTGGRRSWTMIMVPACSGGGHPQSSPSSSRNSSTLRSHRLAGTLWAGGLAASRRAPRAFRGRLHSAW
eukprot:6596300-Pyramimonas_sp.AAC.1